MKPHTTPERATLVSLDSFSGAAADIPKGKRTAENVLIVLERSPRVSTWDMEAHWLRNCIERLKQDALIREDEREPYPWHRYSVTEAGRAVIRLAKATGASA